MQIYIREDAMVKDIQDKFQTVYPYLKLEFYRKPHRKGEYSSEEEKISPDTLLESIRIRNDSGWLDISYYRTAAAVEHDFSYIFGLSAQVLRKAGTLWLETTSTDSWTLEELNNAGKPPKRRAFQLPERPEDD
ncbi:MULTISPECIES: hypothetical protein [unclassified Chitinophaga]|uniref:hypothetical protein n=1 Tax=unclassified Chitinophaga TaxID=2619133 RepID=UPI00301037F1